MKYVNAITWPVSEPATFRILATHEVLGEFSVIEPVVSPNHVKRSEDPPRVTGIRQFIGAPIEASAVALPLAKPQTELVVVNEVSLAQQQKTPYTAVHLSSMRLPVDYSTVRAVEVQAGLHVGYTFFSVNAIQLSQQIK